MEILKQRKKVNVETMRQLFRRFCATSTVSVTGKSNDSSHLLLLFTRFQLIAFEIWLCGVCSTLHHSRTQAFIKQSQHASSCNTNSTDKFTQASGNYFYCGHVGVDWTAFWLTFKWIHFAARRVLWLRGGEKKGDNVCLERQGLRHLHGCQDIVQYCNLWVAQ